MNSETQLPGGNVIVVKAAFDTEARVWFVESRDVPGLNIEAESLEAMLEKLPDAIADLVDAGDPDRPRGRDLPIELIAHAGTRLRSAA